MCACLYVNVVITWANRQLCCLGPVATHIKSNQIKYVTGFVRRGLPHTPNLPTLTIHNFKLNTAL